MELLHQSSSLFLFSPALCLSHCSALLAAAFLEYGANPVHTHAGSASASTAGNGRDEHRELCMTLNWGELFARVLYSFWGLVGIKEGIRQSSCFSGQPAFGRRSIIAEMAGSSCYHLGIQILAADLFTLSQRKTQAQKSRKQLINFLSWPGNQTDMFQRESHSLQAETVGETDKKWWSKVFHKKTNLLVYCVKLIMSIVMAAFSWITSQQALEQASRKRLNLHLVSWISSLARNGEQD